MGCKCSRTVQEGSDIRDKYKIGRLLGSGAFGQVRECTDRITKEALAVKIMEKKGTEKGHWSNENMFKREVRVLETLDHPNIVRFYDFYEDRHFLYAVMEKCDGGELFDQVLRRKHFDEGDAAVLCGQMLRALEHLHAKRIVHRDVKAENFLFKTKDRDSELKLIDFGMSSEWRNDEMKMVEICGSPHYLSPELIRRNYDFKADMWALGVLLYLLLFGRYPFDGPNTNAIVKEIVSKNISWKIGSIEPSVHAKDFMKKLLERDPKKRLSAKDALTHCWIARAPLTKQTTADLMEVVRSAHRKVTGGKIEVDAKVEERRNRLLARLDNEWRQGTRTGGVRLSTLNKHNVSRPEYFRPNNRVATTPSRLNPDDTAKLKALRLSVRGDPSWGAEEDEDPPSVSVHPGQSSDEIPVVRKDTATSSSLKDGVVNGSTADSVSNVERNITIVGYSQFVRGRRGRAYTMDYAADDVGEQQKANSLLVPPNRRPMALSASPHNRRDGDKSRDTVEAFPVEKIVKSDVAHGTARRVENVEESSVLSESHTDTSEVCRVSAAIRRSAAKFSGVFVLRRDGNTHDKHDSKILRQHLSPALYVDADRSRGQERRPRFWS